MSSQVPVDVVVPVDAPNLGASYRDVGELATDMVPPPPLPSVDVLGPVHAPYSRPTVGADHEGAGESPPPAQQLPAPSVLQGRSLPGRSSTSAAFQPGDLTRWTSLGNGSFT